MKIYGYIRVSTDKQTTENQKFEICRFLSEKSLSVDVWVISINVVKSLEGIFSIIPSARLCACRCISLNPID